MTTIAYRSGVLAADTLAVVSNLRDGYSVKVAKCGPFLAAEAGTASYGLAFLDWFRGGMRGDPPSMGDEGSSSTGAIFCPDETLLLWQRFGWSRHKVDAWSMGSGGDMALGAMEAGATPEEAVRVAMTRDIYTGGEITVLRREQPDENQNLWGDCLNAALRKLREY